MQEILKLYIPNESELFYRQKILSDPQTMSYNKGCELGFDGYDNETGCIAFTEDKFAAWHSYWINNEPERFYAYLQNESGEFIGEVNFHITDSKTAEIGIIIEAKQRKKGYSRAGLTLLIEKAKSLGVEKLINRFEFSRTAALKTHLAVGFKKIDENAVELILN